MLRDNNNNPQNNDIVTFKLVSGEEIVGKLVERTIDSVFISKPVQIGMQQVSPNQVGLAFLPVLGSVHDATLQFPLTSMCVRPTKTGEDVKRNYIKATTGIVTPDAATTASIISP